MSGGAEDQSQTSDDNLLLDPAILDHRRHSPPRVLPSGHGFQEIDSPPIPDELVQEILLRLPTPADLVRASASCPSFRLLVSCRSFLRRFRKLHAPPLLGFLSPSTKFFRVIPPSPSASAARAADFSFSFLPGPTHEWRVRDVRDGRVLLTRSRFHNRSLVVCDPLYRRYLLLPPIPEVEGLVPSSANNPHCKGWQAFLGDDQDATEETSFTAILIVSHENKHAAFVFSSSMGQWRASTWTAGFGFFFRLWYANGCFYGVTKCRKKLLALDTRRMEFSLSDLPPEAQGFLQQDIGPLKKCVNIAIVEAGEGITGMFVLLNDTSNITYLIRRNNGGSSNQWQLKKTIPVDSSRCLFMSSTGRYLLLLKMTRLEAFTLDIKTFQLEKVFTDVVSSYAYRNFPPSLLSSPTISSGTLSILSKLCLAFIGITQFIGCFIVHYCEWLFLFTLFGHPSVPQYKMFFQAKTACKNVLHCETQGLVV